MKQIASLVTFCCLSIVLAQPASTTFTVNGTVKASTGGLPLEGLTVSAVGLNSPTVQTDENGLYRLTFTSPPGKIQVEVKGGGYVPQQREITADAASPAIRLDFELQQLSASIDVVESLREYHLEETSLATRSPVKLIDLPQSVQVYPNQLIEDRAILEGNEPFLNVSGMNQSTYSAMVFRGFTQREILYNGARGNPFGSLEGDVNNAGFSTSQIRLTNIQRVEVLKGPTSALYGSGEAGGLINYVTKQPKETLDGEIQMRLGSFNQKCFNGDISGPLGKYFLARGAFYYEDRDTFRLNSTAENSHAAAAIVYRPSDRHRFTLEAEYLNQILGGQRLRGIPVTATGNFLTAIQWSANEPSDRIKMIGRVLQFAGTHDLSRGWNVNYTFRYLQYENNDKYHEPRGLNAATATGQTMRREYRNYFRANDDWALTVNAVRRFKTASIRHTVVAGFEQFDQDHVFRNARAREREVAGGTVPSLDLFHPVYGAADPSTYTMSVFTISTANTRRSGYYGQDQVELNRFFQVLLSGRVDHYNDSGFALVPLRYENTALSGRAGLVFKPVQKVSIYTNYANSFIRAPVFAQAPAANGPFPPETGRQWEVGAKTEVINRKLFLSAAYFHIDKKNMLRADPALGPNGDNANAVLPVGAARSRGLELNAEGFLTSRWYVTTNYAFVDTKITKDNVLSLVGQRLANAPRHTAGLFTRYNVLKHTGIGFGLEGVSERIEPFAGLRADGYAVVDAGIYQDLHPRAKLQLQVTNVANSTYSVSSLFAARAGNIPGQPRAIMVTLTVNPFRRNW